MKYVSFITNDTKRSIPVALSVRQTFTVYLKDEIGRVWREDNYQGNGNFGGKNFYVLLAEMNSCDSGDFYKDKYMGMVTVLTGEPYIAPIITEDINTEWFCENVSECPWYGFYYPELKMSEYPEKWN